MKKITDKKKLVIILVVAAVFLAGIALIIHHATKLTNESYANCALGDVDGDGYISAGDALLVIQSMTDKDLLFENQMLHADVNKDGKVDSSDALILLRYSIGEIHTIPLNEKDEQDKVENSDRRSAKAETENSLSTVKIINEWDNNDGTHSYQLGVTVKNTGDEEIDFWSSKILFSCPVKLSKSWDCKCRVNSDEVSLNSESVPVESAAVCGFIVTAQKGMTIKTVETECK